MDDCRGEREKTSATVRLGLKFCSVDYVMERHGSSPGRASILMSSQQQPGFHSRLWPFVTCLHFSLNTLMYGSMMSPVQIRA